MSTYSRMGINVTRLIALVEGCPCIWDLTDPKYSDRHLKQDAWAQIIRTLYPEIDTMAPRLQKQISNDVHNRWRSVRDQFRRYENDPGKSGKSPNKRPFVYAEQMQFLRTGRELRRTEGNIAAPETEVEDVMCSSSGSAGDLPPSQDSAPGPSHITRSPVRQRSSSSQRLTRSGTRRAQSTSRSTMPRAVEIETLDLIQRVEKEDHWDQLGASIAARLREMPHSRRWVCVPAVFELMRFYANPQPIPDNIEIITGIKNIFEKIHTSPIFDTSTFFHHSSPNIQQSCPTIAVEDIAQPTDTEEATVMGSMVSTQQSFLSLLSSPSATSSPLTHSNVLHARSAVVHQPNTESPPMRYGKRFTN
ncbi:uncharacterized protein [Dendropsophus ebraccatus]|uniref:uncharacterized protein isoform X2 n=1 Tax=Dendropsophus ebraccatus TaxID=150705 RepID=UPI0038317461